ncbi:MAG: flagellin [Janthinobacterium lividum]
MRVDPNMSAMISAGINSTAQALNTSIQQLSSGLSVSAPSDNPYAAASNARSLASSANVDRYTKNADAVMSRAQMADSALSSVVSELTQALSLGTEGADGSMTPGNRAAIATQLQGVLQQVVSQANLSYNGSSLFAGTSGTTTPFVADASSASGYTYQGNSGVNQATIGDGLTVNTNVPGDQIFTSSNGNVLGSLSQLISAVSSGNATDIASATSAVSTAISHIGQQRAVYGGTVNQINAQESYLSQESVSLSSQQNALVGIDTANVIQTMTQAQTAHSAVLAAAAKILPTSLLNYLSPQ